ncbi:MAG TPA: sugar ABC transporter ATP-binding protein [Geminicoccaceae bacterium]|nr:sugar ABC transporter ATP-binding protein [Geminicoccaceae bacterium]
MSARTAPPEGGRPGADDEAAAQPLLRVAGAGKRYPGVRALADVDLEVRAGEVHGLLGENGAGKSTLLKILAGAERPDSGRIVFRGREVAPASPQEAQALGVATIYQELNLVPNLTVAENLFIGREPGAGPFVSWRRLAADTRAVLDRLGLRIDPLRPVRDLSVAGQQMVEIARALSMDARLIIMDEPTSALSDAEVETLFGIVRDLRGRGLGIIFVTHRLDEVMRLCDRVTVLRDGRRVGSAAVTDLTVDDLIRMMVGRDVGQLFTPFAPREPGDVALRVTALCRRGTSLDPYASVLDDVSLEVRRGEILGLAGLMGAGRTELARAVFGADPFASGRIEVEGREVTIRSPADAIRHGIGLVPEDRKQQALFLGLAVRTNLSLTALKGLVRFGFVRGRDELALVERFRRALNIRMAGPEQPVGNLSGGNQQKVVLARWLALKPRVLIVDEPTRGIDVAAKAEVHQLLDGLARSGIAVLAISSELPELLAIADRIVTMREGRVTGELPRAEASEERLMQLMTLDQRAAGSRAA